MFTGDLSHAAEVVHRGGIIAYATEYCFGLGCDPRNRGAVSRLMQMKRRPLSKGLILIAADVGQLKPYVVDIPKKALATWPGPHTWLLNPREGTPYWLTGAHPRIAVRVTAHIQAAKLCKAARMALVSTSANRANQHPARSYREVLRRLGADVDYVLPGMVGDLAAPTPIRDAVTGKLVRVG